MLLSGFQAYLAVISKENAQNKMQDFLHIIATNQNATLLCKRRREKYANKN